jgi:hypothetical protein
MTPDRILIVDILDSLGPVPAALDPQCFTEPLPADEDAA